MKIIDCFMFYNELDILNIRLYELYDVVDYIIIIEATKTHSGNEKPLYYNENKEKFSKYNDKIIHFVTDFEKRDYDFCKYINTPNENWFKENYQRECIQIIIDQINLNDDDIIIITDADEIPDKNVIRNIKEKKIEIQNNNIYKIEMTLYYYNIELTTPRKWYHAKLFNYYTYKNNNLLTDIRLSNTQFIFNNAGWHLSYFGDDKFIKNKVESFAESIEYSTEGKNIVYLKDCLDKCILHFNKEQLIHIPLENNKNVPSYYIKL